MEVATLLKIKRDIKKHAENKENIMKYTIRQYDKNLLTFEYTSDVKEGVKTKIEYINEEYRYLLPLNMDVSDDGVLSWLKSRVVPQNREFVDQLLSKNGLSVNDTIGIIKLSKGLSVNDSYWVVEKGFEGQFADFNLYDNKFVKVLSLVAYTGYGSVKKSGFTSSPEFTTNGMLRKGWRRINDKVVLYKGGTSGAANTGKEPYSEFYASQVARAMELDAIPYGLAKWKKSLCSTCELFTDINTSYMPIGRLVKKGGLLACEKYLKELGEEYYNKFVDMLIFDAVICNTDRHYGNFGLLIDNKTNKPVAFAPIFDNGYSLFNFAMDDEIADLKEYSKTRISAEGTAFTEIAKAYITKRQKDQLRKLINFKFKPHKTYNLKLKRLASIEQFIQMRVHELLEFENN